MSEKTLNQLARSREAHFYLQFGGQGTPWFRELQKYYSDAKFKTFFHAIFEALDSEKDKIKKSVGLPQSIDLKSWLEDKNTIPSEKYLSYATISLPLVQATQLAHLEHLHLSGLAREQLLEWSQGGTGHSQGLAGAILIALGKSDKEYYEAVQLFIKYQLYLGVCAQIVFPFLEPNEAITKESAELGNQDISPMVAVLGSNHNTIEKLVAEVNTELDQDKQIYVSLYNSPTNRILSSHRTSLLAFQKKYKEKIEAKEFKYVYLSTTCPFHSPHMKAIVELMSHEIKQIGFSYTAKDLKLPVYSFYDEINYQDLSEDLGIRMCQDLMVNTLYWDKALKKAKEDNKVTHILDFGPGKTSQRLSTDVLTYMECSKPVIALVKDAKLLLA